MTTLAQVTLLTAGADSADNQTNGFYVSDSGISTAEMDSWRNAIKTFYDAAAGNGAMRGLAQNNHIIKFYTVGTPAPNYPIYQNTFNLAASPGAFDLPPEVALCVSYKNNTNNSVLRARRRGRIYLSGWGEAQNTTGRPNAGLPAALAGAFKTYCDSVNLIGTLTACIYSRVQDITNEIEEVWVDNAWDTQRRRGEKPTVRSSVTVTP